MYNHQMLKDYQTWIENRADLPGFLKTKKENKIYAIGGMVEEVGELVEYLTMPGATKNKKELVQKELGDIFWYATLFCVHSKISLELVLDLAGEKNTEWNKDQLVIFTCRLQSRVNKLLRDHNDNVLRCKYEAEMKMHLITIVSLLVAFCKKENYKIEKILQSNKDKITDRISRNAMAGDGDER